MWRYIKIIMFFAVVACLQATLSPRIAVFGVKPDLLLIAVVIWGLSFGAEKGGAVGLLAGFLEDLLSASFYINILIKAMLGYFAGIVRGSIAVASTLVSTAAVAALTPISYLLELMIFYFFFGRPLPSLYSVISVVTVSSLYNAALTAAAFNLIFRTIERVSSGERGDLKEYKLYRM